MSDVVTASKEVTLLEILDRVLNKGVVITGDIVISVADVDLIYVGLRVLVTSVETLNTIRVDHLDRNIGQMNPPSSLPQ